MPDPSETPRVESVSLHGMALEVLRQGSGEPVVFLHGFQPADPGARWMGLLARRAEVIAPSLPGFGASARPKDFESVYDVLNTLSAFLETLGHRKVTLVGSSLGGWLAAELAVRSCDRIARLVLVDALGIKVSDRTTPDILDVFNTLPELVKAATWHDEAKAPDLDAMTDEQLIARHRNWESLALYGWHPYMHNPRLNYWLPRISAPTLVLWGASDGIVKSAYGRAYAARIPGAAFAEIAAAGHHPEIEQPDAFADHLLGFLSR
ncbi:MAG: alpha/beta hydrolase [Acetobacteraceae bacterium]|nr:alpha/beta hydrolase [Acetobacteraceae bacterium]